MGSAHETSIHTISQAWGGWGLLTRLMFIQYRRVRVIKKLNWDLVRKKLVMLVLSNFSEEKLRNFT